jgi:hypothetical protein
VAEDTVRYCNRGHPRIPENLTSSRHCKACNAIYDAGRREQKRDYDAAYHNTIRGQLAHQLSQMRYETKRKGNR